MSTTTNTKPLYKVLNGLRHRGNWELTEKEHDGFTNVYIKNGIGNIVADFGDNQDSLCKTSAKYTALSVNNLSPIADLLQEIVDLLPSIDAQVKGLSFLALSAWMERSKEALLKIS